MRADAQRNFDHLLTVARTVVTEEGADASLRDIARRADVGLGTLYRHFPTRDALLEELLRTGFDALAAHADGLLAAATPQAALVEWMRDCVAFTHEVRGVVSLMAAAMDDPDSALHASCVGLRSSGTQLLVRAQETGVARRDLDGEGFFALIAALAWLNDQPPFASRADHLRDVVADAILQP